jgi:hypothetical protein
MYLSQAILLDRLLEQEFAGIMRRGNLTSNDLRYIPGKELHKLEQLCPCFTPFDHKMHKLSIVNSPALPDQAHVHGMQVAVGTLMYILNSRPDLPHSVHQVACFVHNPGPAHVKALDHILRYFNLMPIMNASSQKHGIGFSLNYWNWRVCFWYASACLILCTGSGVCLLM